ncbi:Aerotolerance protein BatB / Aerotolerance protein BatC [hydrothermal vent metagenome]|uniref:Aerotolerance protein BatB / Aerotolerance protein BatC n=1 Tax=hydrothermal vent metagenome TaxID=652676 RepID=A0A3B1BMR3_9ZZZZ
MAEFHFLRPLWFLALIPLSAILWLLWRRVASSLTWRAVCDPELLPYLLVGEQGTIKRWPVMAVALAGLLGIIALAGPAWIKREQPVFREQSALILALDLSRSMDATDIKPSRLTRARHKILDILKQRREGQTALIVYAGTPFVVTPLTDDQATIASQVSSLETGMMPSQGSRPDLAVKQATELLQQAGQNRGDILLVTDGIDPTTTDAIMAAMGGKNHRISLLAIGTKEGAPITLPSGGFLKNSAGEIVLPSLKSKPLQQLAKNSGGRFHAISIDDSDIQYLLAPLDKQMADNIAPESTLTSDQWQEEGPWLLLLILPLAALTFRRGYLGLAVLFLLPSAQNAEAIEWQDLWSRPDQQAASALQQGDAASAAQQFENQEWKATAQYRTGNYQQAAESLEGIKTPDALYNKGNALAQAGKLPEALQAYDEALALNPEDKDIKYNRDLVEKALEKQQQEQNQDQDQDQDQEQSDQDDQKESQQDQSGEQEQQQNQSGEQGEEPQQGQQEDEQEQAAEDEQKSEDNETDKEQEESQEESQKASPEEATQEENKTDQVTEQWLRRIPDDPGGLLRRKFKYQYQRQQQPAREAQQW